MRGVSIYRLLLAESAFAVVLLHLSSVSAEGENFWPAFASALAVGGIGLHVREENWGQALGVGIAFFVGMVAGNALLAPHPDLVFGIVGIPVGVILAWAYSGFIHQHDRRSKA